MADKDKIVNKLMDLLLDGKLSTEKLKLMLDIANNKSNKNSSNSLPKDFKLKEVAGDGTCFYHSIIESAKDGKIATLKSLRDGTSLRKLITNVLVDEYMGKFKDDNKRQIIKSVSDEMYAVNGKNLNKLNQNIRNENDYNNRLEKILDAVNSRQWGGQGIAILIANHFKIRIKIWNKASVSKNSGWITILPDYMNNSNFNDNKTIYIYYNGTNHFNALVKK